MKQHQEAPARFSAYFENGEALPSLMDDQFKHNQSILTFWEILSILSSNTLKIPA